MRLCRSVAKAFVFVFLLGGFLIGLWKSYDELLLEELVIGIFGEGSYFTNSKLNSIKWVGVLIIVFERQSDAQMLYITMTYKIQTTNI